MIIIVGGGIAGLYLGYQLYQKKIPFTILEGVKTGGKIVTKLSSSHRTPIELGASIFHAHQKHIMGLINEFHIETREVGNIPTKYLPPVPEEVAPYPEPTPTAQPVYKVFSAEQKMHNPQYDEIKEMNYNDWKRGHDRMEKVYVCKNGLVKVIDALKRHVYPYVRKMTVKTIDLGQKTVTTTTGKVLPFDTVVVCTSAQAAKRIRVKGEEARWQRLIRASKTVPTVRVYAEFLEKVPYTTYRVGLDSWRWYIPISKKVALLSYVDGKRANHFIRQGEESSLTEILKSLEIDRATIKRVWYGFWPDSFNVLQYNLTTMFKEDMERVKEGVMCQTFLPEETEQAWMEGHLIQADKVAKKIIQNYKKGGSK